MKKWTEIEKKEYNQSTEYPDYFPKPWQSKESRSFNGQPVCDSSKEVCIPSYYELFVNWESGKGVPSMYDPRLNRNMNKYPNIFSKEKIRERLKSGKVSPHVTSPGISPFMDINNLPPGKTFLDEEDRAEWLRLKKLYDQFKMEDNNNPLEISESFLNKVENEN